jgi:hypothetical protein
MASTTTVNIFHTDVLPEPAMVRALGRHAVNDDTITWRDVSRLVESAAWHRGSETLSPEFAFLSAEVERRGGVWTLDDVGTFTVTL